MRSASLRWNGRRRWAVLALALCALGAQAQEGAPVIREIAFTGNAVTQPRTMLRQMYVKVGDPADPRQIERSRQGVQDLGLFRSVTVRQVPVDGGVRLVFGVKEKHYILPLPRADASSDGGYGYGVQLRWDNVWGLNHTFNPYFERRQPSEGDADIEKRGVQTRTQLRYSAPFVFDSDFSASLAAGYFNTPYVAPLEYDATTTFFNVGLSRKLSEGPGTQGWYASTGLGWSDERHSGPAVPTDPADAAKGRAVAMSAGLSWRDLHFNVYSDEGSTASFGVASATESVLSDYDYTNWNFSYGRYVRLGTTHQNLNLLLDLGERHDGSYGGDAYAIGGTETLRGFEPETQKGDAFYAASIEYLRPVFRDSIRVLAVIDAANAFPDPGEANLDKVYVSAGFGVRVRIQAFVALDLELGMAWPLNGGGPRLFASKV